jgi:hypothetical protein
MLDVHSARIETSTAQAPLEIATERHSSIYRRNLMQRMVGRFDGVAVTLGVLPSVNGVSFHDRARAHEITVDDTASFYRLNDQDPVPLEMVDHMAEASYFEIDLPPGLSNMNMMLSGGTLLESTARKIEAGEHDVHTMRLAFIVDDQPVRIDLSFSLGLETKRFVASPATP